ncbi:MAG TPA: hypothetical protein VND80_01715 [Steroidobacteraceae bacterium]|nr:hypothetical protein [Steroidobacteraceae bacterium]
MKLAEGFGSAARHPRARLAQPRLYLAAIQLSLVLLLAVLWTLTHQYGGLTRDAHIYAFQAFARIRPALQTDIYLRNTSQDRFTLFSPIYAACIRTLGLHMAGALLLGFCAAWFLTAAWFFANEVTNRDLAWFSVAMLILTVGVYGAYGIFHYSEDYLTARSPAEALVVTAFACQFGGKRLLALLAVTLALMLHPLMAFPGLLMLLCAWTSLRWNAIGTAGGIAAALVISSAAVLGRVSSGPLAVMDPAWLEVVRERSQFLFLQLWHWRDWDLNARPFLTVAFAALVSRDDPRLRKLCIGALLVGGSGLAVAGIAGAIGPVALLLQGQAWRWDWVTSVTGVILIPASFVRLWRDATVGPFCAILLVLAWTLPSVDGTAAVGAAIALWAVRTRIGPPLGRYLRWAAIGLAALAVVWAIGNSWTYLSSKLDLHDGALLLQRLRNIFGLKPFSLLLVLLVWRALRRFSGFWLPLSLSTALLAVLIVTTPFAFSTPPIPGLTARRDVFTNWRRAIAPSASVYVDDGGDSPIFAWLTLRRPSYLSVDQSAGVVFSRKTALEIRRRANVLRPLMPPDYQILTKRRAARIRKRGAKKAPWPKPLTRSLLVKVCRDPALGFLIAHQYVGFGAIPHTAVDAWKNWYLYDCRRVRATMRGA